jgi:hypothetical protein
MIRNIGAIEGKQPVKANEWEEVKRKQAVQQWIKDSIANSDCVVVLVGSETANRPLVIDEIVEAWNTGRGLLGIRVHNINCPRNCPTGKGANPFDSVSTHQGTQTLTTRVPLYDPGALYAYSEIQQGIEGWVADAIKRAGNR